VTAAIEDLSWFGFKWQEGGDVGGAFGPYVQSERLVRYREAFEQLQKGGHVFPCSCSRRDILGALSAPHAGDEEPVYPGTCRGKTMDPRKRVSWRFRVPNDVSVVFEDGGFGNQEYVAGRDFGDFVVWRGDGFPSYQLACVVDDTAMQVTEVVRGADLLLSTARQILLYRALGWSVPEFYHCPLVTDASGERLAKRHDALSLRKLRESGASPESLREGWV